MASVEFKEAVSEFYNIDFGDLDQADSDNGIPIEVITYGDKQMFVPTTDEHFEWVLEKLAEAQLLEKQTKERMQSKLASYAQRYKFFWDKYGQLVEQWGRAKVAKEKRAKSYKADIAVVGLREQKAHIEVDETHPEFLPWIESKLSAQSIQALRAIEAIEAEQDRQFSVSVSWLKSQYLPYMVHAAVPSDANTEEMERVVDIQTGQFLPFARFIDTYDKFYVKF